MKKFVFLLVSIVLTCSLAVSAFALTGENFAMFSSSSDVDIPINEHIGGDANGDGVVTLIDVVALLRASVGDTYNTSVHGLDANEDGETTVLDIVLVLRHVLGYNVGLGTLVEAK